MSGLLSSLFFSVSFMPTSSARLRIRPLLTCRRRLRRRLSCISLTLRNLPDWWPDRIRIWSTKRTCHGIWSTAVASWESWPHFVGFPFLWVVDGWVCVCVCCVMWLVWGWDLVWINVGFWVVYRFFGRYHTDACLRYHSEMSLYLCVASRKVNLCS